MKPLFLVLAMMFASAAHALQVGDYVVYTFSYSSLAPQIATNVLSLRQTVLSVDTASSKYVVESVITTQDGLLSTPTKKTIFLSTTTGLKATALMCIALEADFDQVTTPFGEITTCYLENDGGKSKSWFVADFPETIKKFSTKTQEDGTTYEVTQELTEALISP